ncbi:hypothetical protein [Microcoleus sp. D2_18a_D3]|uniref:hypothetical protein n=1 Tax=Microcoleus sp. D2_18a_D3 TaxID=3055330 RepID=UPI002FD2DFFA
MVNSQPYPNERERQVFEAEREKDQITKRLKSAFKSLAWQYHQQQIDEGEFNIRWQNHPIHSMDYYETVWYLMQKGFCIQELLNTETQT